jgi:hypothetical protein
LISRKIRSDVTLYRSQMLPSHQSYSKILDYAIIYRDDYYYYIQCLLSFSSLRFSKQAASYNNAPPSENPRTMKQAIQPLWTALLLPAM